MTREESLQLLHSVYEDIKNITQEDIDDFNNTINEYKKEQKVNKEEAIEKLKNIKSVPSTFVDEIIQELVEIFKQPTTLSDILGWKEGQEYRWRGDIFRIQSDILQIQDRSDKGWYDSAEELNDYIGLRKAKKVEPRLKAWFVKDEYSFKELQKELESKGVHQDKSQKHIPADFFKDDNSIYVYAENEVWYTSSLKNVPGNRYIIEYYKVEPKHLLQTDLTSENGIQYLSFDKERRKYFLGALMADKNVQQAFTDDEISKMNAITRFAKLCKKIKVE